MAITVDSIDKLQQYLRGVLGRAGHHAENVEGVALALLGAVIWKSDGEIEVREYNGRPANMIWFWVNGEKYLIKFNHDTWMIELCSRSTNGNVLASFDDSTSYADVIAEFNKL